MTRDRPLTFVRLRRTLNRTSPTANLKPRTPRTQTRLVPSLCSSVCIRRAGSCNAPAYPCALLMAGLVKGIKGGIKRIFGSQDGEGAEEANDVGSPTPYLQRFCNASRACWELSESSASTLLHAHGADAMSIQLNHAPSPELSANPWASTNASPRQAAVPVDRAGPYESDILPKSSQRRLQGPSHGSKRRSVIAQIPRHALPSTRAGQEQGLIHEQTVRRYEGTESCAWISRPVWHHGEGGLSICSRGQTGAA